MDFSFNMPVRVVCGENALFKNKELIRAYGKKCGIVTGRTSAAKSGALDDIKNIFAQLGIDYIIYDGITENPLISSCHEAGGIFSEGKVDFIFGIGGGSVLDASKAIAIYTANPYLYAKDIYLRKYDNEPLPVLLIGTTSGTGSEVSAVSVLTNDETGRKKSISGQDCYAKVVFADPKYNYSMPYSVTVSTALDALSHAVEGYFTTKCTDIPMLFAQKAIPLLWNCLCELDEIGEEEFNSIKKNGISEYLRALHENLYYGSLFAGMVLNPCGTVFPHPLGYVLTENYGIPHGKACTAFMTELIVRAQVFEPVKSDRLFALLKTEKDIFCKKIEKLTALPEIKMTKEEIEKFCSRWENAEIKNFTFTPGGYSKDDAESVFLKRFS